MITKREIQQMLDDCSARMGKLSTENNPLEVLAILGESSALLKIYVKICLKEKDEQNTLK